MEDVRFTEKLKTDLEESEYRELQRRKQMFGATLRVSDEIRSMTMDELMSLGMVEGESKFSSQAFFYNLSTKFLMADVESSHLQGHSSNLILIPISIGVMQRNISDLWNHSYPVEVSGQRPVAIGKRREKDVSVGAFECLQVEVLEKAEKEFFGVVDRLVEKHERITNLPFDTRILLITLLDLVLTISHFAENATGRTGEEFLVAIGKMIGLEFTVSEIGFRGALGNENENSRDSVANIMRVWLRIIDQLKFMDEFEIAFADSSMSSKDFDKLYGRMNVDLSYGITQSIVKKLLGKELYKDGLFILNDDEEMKLSKYLGVDRNVIYKDYKNGEKLDPAAFIDQALKVRNQKQLENGNSFMLEIVMEIINGISSITERGTFDWNDLYNSINWSGIISNYNSFWRAMINHSEYTLMTFDNAEEMSNFTEILVEIVSLIDMVENRLREFGFCKQRNITIVNESEVLKVLEHSIKLAFSKLAKEFKKVNLVLSSDLSHIDEKQIKEIVDHVSSWRKQVKRYEKTFHNYYNLK